MLSFCKVSKVFHVEMTHEKNQDELFKYNPHLQEFAKVALVCFQT